MHCGVCDFQNSDEATICRSCASPLSASCGSGTIQLLAPGTKLEGGRYSVGKVLGQGGFGITYLGGDTKLNRSVAIKEFFPSGCMRENRTVVPAGAITVGDFQSGRSKFLDEARMVAQFNHPSIVHVYSFFEENNTAYMAMEFIRGRTLAGILDDEGPLLEDKAIAYITRAADALDTVHKAALIHRDIKPENVMVREGTGGEVVLVDFGTARQFVAGKARGTSAILTHGYAPLEQYSRHVPFGPYSDVYALSATLYHLLTGMVPVQATDRANGVELRAPHQVNGKISRAVSDAVMWALQMKAPERPQSVLAFVEALKKGVPRKSEPKRQNGNSYQTSQPQGQWNAPRPTPVSPHQSRIDDIIAQLESPTPVPPASSRDTQIQALNDLLKQHAEFRVDHANLCPGCRQYSLNQVTGQTSGFCPLCRSGKLQKRRLDHNRCPICRESALTRQRLPHPVMFCPVCRSGALSEERRRVLGLAVDLWWVCRECKAEFDVGVLSQRATLVTAGNDPFGFGRQHLGETLPIANWQQHAPLTDTRCSCSSCQAEFYEFHGDRMVLGSYANDPQGTAKQNQGKTFFKLMWTKIAHGLPPSAGNVFCPDCKAEFDFDDAAKTLNLLACDMSRYGWAQAYRGNPTSLDRWYLASAGKRSLHPGWLCASCSTEFDETPTGLKLVYSSYGQLGSYLGECLRHADWHRRLAGVPTLEEAARLRNDLALVHAEKQNEVVQFKQAQAGRRVQLEKELAELCKHSLLHGELQLNPSDLRFRLRDTESLLWESAGLKLKQRTQQGMPYWDNEGDGTWFVTNERITFIFQTGNRWERAISKLTMVDQAYIQSVPVIAMWFDGLQKPIGLVVSDKSLTVTIKGRSCYLSLAASDLFPLLRERSFSLRTL